MTKQCCHGFSRPRTSDVTAACEKLDVKSFTETAEQLGSKEFMRSVGKNDLKEKFDDNITLFMPTDEAFTDFSEQMLENVRMQWNFIEKIYYQHYISFHRI